MDHMQTSSLADLMQLLPGGVVSNPNLSSASTMNIRAFGNYYGDNAESGALNMNSLGTAIIMDGSPILEQREHAVDQFGNQRKPDVQRGRGGRRGCPPTAA
ncbi:MAG: hypothetical protein ACLR8Y_19565 [Alistipes indistinctus]